MHRFKTTVFKFVYKSMFLRHHRLHFAIVRKVNGLAARYTE